MSWEKKFKITFKSFYTFVQDCVKIYDKFVQFNNIFTHIQIFKHSEKLLFNIHVDVQGLVKRQKPLQGEDARSPLSGIRVGQTFGNALQDIDWERQKTKEVEA